MIFRRRRRRGLAGSDDVSKGSSSNSEEEPEPFQEMYSIFRIVAFYELMLHGQWQYVNRFLKVHKPELVLGMYIGAAFELVRFVCALLIAVFLILMRISVILPLEDDQIYGNLMWVSAMNALSLWVALLLCILIAVQFTLYQCKNAERIVISTAINFVFSFILIAAIIHLAVLNANNDAFLKEGFHKRIMIPNPMVLLSNYQQKLKCCGIEGPMDYQQSHILRYTNPLTEKVQNVPLTREFALVEKRFLSIPQTCCKNQPCSSRNLTVDETREALEYYNDSKWDFLLKFFLTPETNTYHSRGCLTESIEFVDRFTTILFVALIIFAIFTGLTVGFVIVLLLYQGGIGHMVSDQKMFGVERNTGVHFLMSLDKLETDFQDDFSLIEFLRRSDIDKFVAEDRLDDTIKGRKDAEKM